MSPSLRAELRRTNFAGREVTLAEGALVIAGVTAWFAPETVGRDLLLETDAKPGEALPASAR